MFVLRSVFERRTTEQRTKNTEQGVSMYNNPLNQLSGFGQSFWLDYIRRDFITGGLLKKMIDEDGLCGMTSNPAIFEKALSGSAYYDEDIRILGHNGMDEKSVFELITVRDVQMAADVFMPVYENSGRRDGYVSLEINPHLANDTLGSIEEARRLWKSIDRKNVMIKIPATKQGLIAVTELTREGINVNCTLLFGLTAYKLAAQAYIDGIKGRLADGVNKEHPVSVASFFLSRIDSYIDPLLDNIIQQGGDEAARAGEVLGETAAACSKKAYQVFKEMFGTEKFGALAGKGVLPQRLLWASTGAKNPAHSVIKYVEGFIGRDTINTMPPGTVDAYRAKGRPEACLEKDIYKAAKVLSRLSQLGIDIELAAQQLEEQGLDKFNEPYDRIMEIIRKKSR